MRALGRKKHFFFWVMRGLNLMCALILNREKKHSGLIAHLDLLLRPPAWFTLHGGHIWCKNNTGNSFVYTLWEDYSLVLKKVLTKEKK